MSTLRMSDCPRWGCESWEPWSPGYAKEQTGTTTITRVGRSRMGRRIAPADRWPELQGPLLNQTRARALGLLTRRFLDMTRYSHPARALGSQRSLVRHDPLSMGRRL